MSFDPRSPALVLAPMEGVTDPPMRALMAASGAFGWCVAEFVRVSSQVLPARVFRRAVPELAAGAAIPRADGAPGTPVQVQILGGDPGRVAASALAAVAAGARGIDLNFGCPAKTVNRNDGGATLLRHPERLRAIVRAVRDAVPADIPVSAKLRLGWDDPADVDRNAAMAAEGGADWLTLHGRTRAQGYRPPADWEAIGRVRRALGVPVLANGDLWTVDDVLRCREVTGCAAFMLGRGALADPRLPRAAARALGVAPPPTAPGFEGLFEPDAPVDWPGLMRAFRRISEEFGFVDGAPAAMRLKQWAALARGRDAFPAFDAVKRAPDAAAFLAALEAAPPVAPA